MPPVDPAPQKLLAEGERIMRICNSCRYCEGYCAVFPAMERRLVFAEGDLNYLANLCHNCSECYYACQYAPPHEFAVNVPKVLADIRAQSYRQYVWPSALGVAFKANTATVALVLAACVAGALFFVPRAQPGPDFYAVISHRAIVFTFGGISLFVLLAFAIGFVRFWRNTGQRLSDFANPAALARALRDALTLRYLDGGGGGCSYPGERQSQSRRWFHHFVFYGFALCFASTTTAAIYHYAFGWSAPYGYWSAPVVLGTSGGLALAAGTLGLLWLKRKRNPETQGSRQGGMDIAFLLMLFLASVSGLLLLALRNTGGMAGLLVVHLAVVAALFVTLPYGKFVHAIYRPAALVKYALERLRVGSTKT